MKLIVGLGNVGDEYKDTRHNVGFEVVEKMIQKLGFDEIGKIDKKMSCRLLVGNWGGQKIVFMMPTTYMNNSGLAVEKVKNYYQIDEKDILIIHDDLDLSLGQLMIKKGGGSGGHHGVESVMKSLSSNIFLRIRIGIGKDKNSPVMDKITGANYVLGRFEKNEMKQVAESIEMASDAVVCCLEKQTDICMNLYNKKISNNMPMESDAS